MQFRRAKQIIMKKLSNAIHTGGVGEKEAWRVNMSQLVQIPNICLWHVNKSRRHGSKNIANNVCCPAIFISLKHKYLKMIFTRGQRFVPVTHSVPFCCLPYPLPLFFRSDNRWAWFWPGTPKNLTRVRKKPCKQIDGKVGKAGQQLVNYIDWQLVRLWAVYLLLFGFIVII